MHVVENAPHMAHQCMRYEAHPGVTYRKYKIGFVMSLASGERNIIM